MEPRTFSPDLLSTLTNNHYKDLIDLICDQCNCVFQRSKKNIQIATWQKTKTMYCSRECQNKAANKRTSHSCYVCNSVFERVPSHAQSERVFCSQSCAAKHNNTRYPKRSVEGRCKSCLTPIKAINKFCKKCRTVIDFRPEVPICDFFTQNKAASIYTNIRWHARKFYLETFEHECINCGYNLQIDIAHIKPISKFDPQTPLGIVNATSNLAGLCKRCHWELDHQHLSPDVFKEKRLL